MDGRSAPDHVHRFLPARDGELYGKPRYRNTCVCGVRQHPEPPKALEDGPRCRACGFPTVAGTVDPTEPLHPCCAEPRTMAIGSAAARARRRRR